MYLLSNFKNYGTAKYFKDKSKQRKQKIETPGPGTYQAPSEFGYLDMYKFSNRDPGMSMMSTGRGQTPDKFQTSRNHTPFSKTGQVEMDRAEATTNYMNRRNS